MGRLLRFFRRDLWETDLRQRAFPVRLAFSVLRVIAHVLATFDTHLLGLRAGGLTIVTLLSIVPLFAIAFGAAEGFGYRDVLDEQLARSTADMPTYLEEAVAWIRDLVERTSFRGLGVAGSLLLAYTGLNLFIRVEQALNQAWRTSETRGWITRVSSFLALVFVVPLSLLAALVAISTLQSAAMIQELRRDLPTLMTLYDAGLWLVPYGLATLAFTALYKFMPSVTVRWFPALLGGVFAGAAVLGMHRVYVEFQVGVARTNAIYATLAALPLLLVYLQAVWVLILFGAEISYAVQNLHRIGPGHDLGRAAPAVREHLAVWLVHRASRRFAAGQGPLSLTEAASDADLPRDWLDMIAEQLFQAGLLAPVRDGHVVPARPVDDIDFRAVVAAVRGEVPPLLQQRMDLPDGLDQVLRAGDPVTYGAVAGRDGVPRLALPEHSSSETREG